MNKFLELLRNIDPNDPGRWPLVVRIGVVAIVFVVAAIASAYFLGWSPEQPLLEQAKNEEKTLFDTLEQKARKAANLEAYKAQIKEMEQSFNTMLRQLPSKTQIPNLLVDISQTALAAGLEAKLFQPEQEVRKDFYAENPIKIRYTGSFHSIGNFISGVAALPRIVTLHDIQIEPLQTKEKDRGDGTDQLQFNVTAKTYRYLDEDEQAVQTQSQQPHRAGAR
jgi:type IV pilus assembly protein PilO